MATLVVGGFLVFFVHYGLLTYVPVFTVRELNASAAAVGVILSLRGVARIVISPMTGRVTIHLTDRWGLVVALGIMTVALMALPFTSSVLTLGGIVGLYGLGSAISNPVMNNAITERTASTTHGGVISGMNTLRNVGKAAGPAVLGVTLVRGSFVSIFWVSAAIIAGYTMLVALGVE